MIADLLRRRAELFGGAPVSLVASSPLRDLRTLLGLTAEDLAAKLGISRAAISSREANGTGIHLRSLLDVAEVEGLDVEIIVRRKGPPASKASGC